MFAFGDVVNAFASPTQNKRNRIRQMDNKNTDAYHNNEMTATV